MKPERWVEIENLYNEIVDLDPAERDARLASISDNEVRGEVISLIQSGPLPPSVAECLNEERGRVLVQLRTATLPVLDPMPIYSPGPITLTFKAGDLLAARYQIVDFLGLGGMGEVYEAEDQDIGERIAIKVIRLETGFNKDWSAGFRREVQLARRVTHPNVCRVFDMDRHRQAEREIYFLTMELVRGETLAERLKRAGRLSICDALPIAIQLCSALHAAHQAGIIHRDLKCGNVMLVGSGEQVRVVVTDFGTARLMDHAHGSMQAATQQSAIPGTPAYMSPEQLEGKELTPASDIYSLGLVLYEMVAGTRPFRANSPWAEATKRLQAAPEPPSSIVPEIGENWNVTILRCLERDPTMRFSSAQEVSDSLQKIGAVRTDLQELERDRELESAGVAGKQGEAQPRSKKWLWGLIAALVASLAFLGWMLFRAHPTPALTEKDVVVLADFTNNTGEPVFDGTLKDALAIDLEQSPLLNILSDVKVAQLLKLMGRPNGGRLTPEASREICLRSNSRALIAGSIARLGSHYAIQLKATNCATGDLLGAAEVEADSRENTLRALGRAAAILRSKIGESLASVQKFDKPLPEATTFSLEALQAYSEGIRAGLKGNSEAIPFFEHAVELDPKFALAYVRLGAAYGYNRQRGLLIENMRKAYEQREHVSTREGYEISGAYYRTVTGEFLKTVQQYRLLVQEYPNFAVAHYNLGYAYLLLGQYDEGARETKEALRLEEALSLEPTGGASFLTLAYAYMALNQLDNAQAALNQALSRIPDQPFVHYLLYQLAFARNDEAVMQQQIAWSKGKPRAEGALFGLESANDAFHGRMRKALELDHRAFEADRQDISQEAAADLEVLDAIRLAEFGDLQAARNAARSALAHGVSAVTSMPAPTGNSFALATLALARAGDTADAQREAKTLAKKAPLDALVQNFWLPTIRAEIEITNGHAAEAIDLLRATVPYELNDVGALASVYTRGRAYLALGDGAAAAEEFQKVLDHQVTWFRFPWPLAYLGLARARALQAHSATGPAATTAKAQAQTAYQDFLALWNHADPDIPILRQAKAEYAKLIQ
jgi:serine/threonine protein kinase/tetratricopeptide (TPR) repeat protein